MRKGTKMSEESRLKMSLSKKGKPNFKTRGIKRTEETREKMSLAHIGKKLSLSTRQKVSEAQKSLKDKHWNWKGGISSDKKYRDWQKNQWHHRRRSASGSHTFTEWENLKAQYNWTCPCCKKSEPEIKLTLDHIIPLSRGGSDNIENIQPLCKICNCKKHSRIFKY